jgi:DNA invertase Pin-like site-specific DNA recombinase
MIASAKQKTPPFNAILVWKLSRFARNREDAVIYKALLRKHGVNVISINEQIDDTPSGKLLEGMIEAIDEFYSANLSCDTIRGMKENAQRGFLNGSVPPFGYKRTTVQVGQNKKAKLAIDETAAPLVKRIFRMCLEGQGAKEIAKTLNGQGLRTRKGKKWQVNTICYVLRNETYTGTLIFNRVSKNSVHPIQRPASDTIRFENAHPAIISRDTFKKAQELIKQRSRQWVHPRTISSNYLLSGFLYCSCGSPMGGCPAKTSTFFYYGCRNRQRHGNDDCVFPLVNKDRLERAVIERLKSRVLTRENLMKLVLMVNEELAETSGQTTELTREKDAQLAEAKQKLQKLYSALETGRLDLEDLAPRIKELRAQIEELERSKVAIMSERGEPIHADGREVEAYVSDLHDLLSKGSIVEQKSFLRSWIKRITLNGDSGGTIEYNLPIAAVTGNGGSNREVLSLSKNGVPNWLKDRTFRVGFQLGERIRSGDIRKRGS